MTGFVSGLDLAERFYRECVLRILDRRFPGLPHAAALLGPGSEVLGYDDETSMDHGWGPRLQLFLGERDHAERADAIGAAMGRELPYRFLGHPTSWTVHASGSPVLDPRDERPVRHRVEVVTAHAFFESLLGADPAQELRPSDWLAFPQSVLRGLTAGRVFRDDVGLEQRRTRLHWYPRDVWLYLLAAGWQRIGQEEPFVGRAGSTGDDLGSRLIAARLARDAVRLAFLMERTYAPYSKWLGRAFRGLPCAAHLGPPLERALGAASWKEREAGLAEASAALARMQNGLGLVDSLSAEPRRFHDRAFTVIDGARFARPLLDAVEDADLRSLAARPPVGGVDQLSDSTDLLAPAWRARVRRLYDS